ncbi:MAG TPA: phosphoserine transaminase [Fimbriimonadaceae bacterium]|jgi:phosphoserine aminotransferase
MSQPYSRVFNFSAGPCTLPVSALEEARDGMLNWNGSGMSVMEMSHRGKVYEGIFSETEANLRKLLGIPENYKILFLQGGASFQNTMIPMNYLREGQTADYVVSGAWGKKSQEAAKLIGNVHTAFDGKAGNYNDVPDLESLQYSDDPAYIHFTTNETIHGVEIASDPSLKAPVVCDMSSDILSRPVDISKYALIYAGAQKNMGPAGVTVVIIRDDLVAKVPEKQHPMMDYKLMVENDSMYNTPPCWGIYVCGLVYKWVIAQGGLAAMNKLAKDRSSLIYEAVEASGGFYKGHALPASRSIMNVTFTLGSDELTDKFIKEAKAEKLDGLKGHRSVGGCRASIYNAFPVEGCQVLANFMEDFAAKNG